MHRRITPQRAGIDPMVVLGLALAFVLRGSSRLGQNQGTAAVDASAPAVPTGSRSGRSESRCRRALGRLAVGMTFVALFVAGGALSAAAGDTLGELVESSGEEAAPPDCATASSADAGSAEGTTGSEATCETGGDTTPGDGSTATPDSGSGAGSGDATTGSPDSSGGGDGSSGTSDPGGPAPPAESGSGSGNPPSAGNPPPSGSHGGGGASTPPAAPLLDATRSPLPPKALDPEGWMLGATVWLHRTLPDPTPRAKRLAPAFARTLTAVSARHGVSWTHVLAVVRAEGHDGRVPATRERLQAVAARLANLRRALGTRAAYSVFLAFSARPTFADRAVALERYNRAVGLRALVVGLRAAKRALAVRVLRDERIEIYAGGREDVRAGRIDVRVLVLLRYLRIAHGGVSVSSLVTGHRIYARPGAVSAHVYGLAVDVTALGGVPILGNQEPGGLTERAVRNVLLLPAEVSPRQVISLLGLGRASFALADHHDHLHVGY